MKKLIALSMISILGSVGLSYAQTATNADSNDEPRRGRHGKWLEQADTNKDGQVSEDERTAFHATMKQRFFEKHDADGSGELSQEELSRMPAEEFAKLDADESGGLSLEEMPEKGPGRGHHGRGRHGRGGGHGKGIHMFKQADSNSDGKITRAEMQAAAEKLFAKMDANGDGTLTEDELKPKGAPRGVAKSAADTE